ncbi:MAG: hypothetical protein QG632_718 [Candidatus Dependentiae bacterium]|nr:hypothetical protein [Candidatus Dependentiae bacterium]
MQKNERLGRSVEHVAGGERYTTYIPVPLRPSPPIGLAKIQIW